MCGFYTCSSCLNNYIYIVLYTCTCVVHFIAILCNVTDGIYMCNTRVVYNILYININTMYNDCNTCTDYTV